MRNAAIPIMLVCHAVAGLIAASFSADEIAVSSAILFGIIFCQSSLLGMWAGLARAHWMLRAIGLTAGSAYLAYLCGWGISAIDYPVFLVVMLPSILVAGVTWITRLLQGSLSRTEGDFTADRGGNFFLPTCNNLAP